MSRCFYVEVSLRELAQIRKVLVKFTMWGAGRCNDCGLQVDYSPEPIPHEKGCRVGDALDILDRHLAPRALKPKLVKSIRQARGK